MSKSSNVLKDQLTGLAGKVKSTLDEVGKNETLKKAGEMTQTIGKKAEDAKKAVGSAAESIGKSGAFKVGFVCLLWNIF
jgi:phage-related protein